MVIPKLAWRNVIGAGTRTWLNVAILSVAFVTLIFLQAFLEGWEDMQYRVSRETEFAGGQIWSPEYDPYDMLTLQDMNAALPPALLELTRTGDAIPVLLYPAVIYPNNLRQGAILRAVPRDQDIIKLPTDHLPASVDGSIPGMMGYRWAQRLGIEEGETFTIQWRDRYGSYDARDVVIDHIMETENFLLDKGFLWLDHSVLTDMIGKENAATYLILREGFSTDRIPDSDWITLSVFDLSEQIRTLMAVERAGSSFYYIFFFSLALLAIFDTQVLSVWRRKKEIGTLMALGMPRGRLIRLFTLEGLLTGVLAAVAALVWGGPLIAWASIGGIRYPVDVESYGVLFPEVLYPITTLSLVLASSAISLLAVTFISWLPVRKLAELTPTDALRGK